MLGQWIEESYTTKHSYYDFMVDLSREAPGYNLSISRVQRLSEKIDQAVIQESLGDHSELLTVSSSLSIMFVTTWDMRCLELDIFL